MVALLTLSAPPRLRPAILTLEVRSELVGRAGYWSTRNAVMLAISSSDHTCLSDPRLSLACSKYLPLININPLHRRSEGPKPSDCQDNQ